MLKDPIKMKENQEKSEEKKVINPWLIDDELFFSDPKCPVCGSEDLIVEGRCTTCADCGWSKCSL